MGLTEGLCMEFDRVGQDLEDGHFDLVRPHVTFVLCELEDGPGEAAAGQGTEWRSVDPKQWWSGIT